MSAISTMPSAMWQLDGVCTSTSCSDGASDDYPEGYSPADNSDQLDGVCTSTGCSDGASDEYPDELPAPFETTVNTVMQIGGVCTASGCSDGSSDGHPVTDESPAEKPPILVTTSSKTSSVSSVPQVDGAFCSNGSCDGASDDSQAIAEHDQRAPAQQSSWPGPKQYIAAIKFVVKVVQLVGGVSRLVNVNEEMNEKRTALD